MSRRRLYPVEAKHHDLKQTDGVPVVFDSEIELVGENARFIVGSEKTTLA